MASSQRIAGRLHEDIAFWVLAANNTPDFRTVSDFRKDDLAALSDLFLQVLVLCQRAGLVKLGHVALDGTKVRANASKHKAMSYKRMKEEAGRLAAELLRRARVGDARRVHFQHLTHLGRSVDGGLTGGRSVRGAGDRQGVCFCWPGSHWSFMDADTQPVFARVQVNLKALGVRVGIGQDDASSGAVSVGVDAIEPHGASANCYRIQAWILDEVGLVPGQDGRVQGDYFNIARHFSGIPA